MKKQTLIIFGVLCLLGFSAVGYAQEAVFLEELGIVRAAENLDAQTEATRGDFVRMVIRMLKFQKGYTAPEQVFSDVTEIHYAYHEIQGAHELGLIQGAGGAAFNPSGKLYPMDAAKIAVYALGYRELVENGGINALSQYTSSLKILYGVQSLNSRALTNADAFKIIVNALNGELCKIVSYGETRRVQAVSGITLLTELYGVEKTIGVVAATQYASLSLSPPIAKNAIKINGDVYSGMAQDSYDLIGRNAICYYYKDNNKIAGVLAQKNTVYESDLEDFETYGEAKLVFSDAKGKREQYALSAATTYLLNNRLLKQHEIRDGFASAQGKVTLIDNNNDGIYDVVLIYSYTTYIFSGYDPETKTIVTQEGRRFQYNMDYAGLRLQTAEGIRINPEQTAYNSVLSVFDPGSSAYYIAITVSDKQAEAVISQTVSGEQYVVDFKNKVYKVKSTEVFNTIYPGKTYLLYLDHTGAIARAQHVDAAGNVIYLMQVHMPVGISGKLEMRYLTAGGEIKTSLAASRVQFRGTNGDLSSVGRPELYAALFAAGKTVRQAMRIALNDNEEITAVILAADANSMNTDFRKLDFGYERLLATETLNRFRYSSSTLSFRNLIRMHAATVVFVVPSAEDTGVSDADFQAVRPLYFANGEAYDITLGTGKFLPTPISLSGNGLLTDVLIWESKTGVAPSIPSTAHGFLITAMTKVLNSETSEIQTKLTGINALAETVSYLYFDYASPEASDRLGKRLSIGDVVRMSAKADGTVDSSVVQTFYDSAADVVSVDAANVIPGYYRYNSAYRLTRARILARDGNIFQCLVDGEYDTAGKSNADGVLTDFDVKEIYDFSALKIITFNRQTKKYTTGLGLPQLGDEFILCLQNGLPRMAIIYQ